MDMISVEICYALPEVQFLQKIEVAEGTNVIRAIMQSSLLEQFPNLELGNNVGIFSQKVSLNHILKEGDRVEIYRPLTQTPNQARLSRAKKSK